MPDPSIVSSNSKSIIVQFDKIFDNPSLEVMNEFTINKKRNFIPLTNSIVKIFEVGI